MKGHKPIGNVRADVALVMLIYVHRCLDFDYAVQALKYMGEQGKLTGRLFRTYEQYAQRTFEQLFARGYIQQDDSGIYRLTPTGAEDAERLWIRKDSS